MSSTCPRTSGNVDGFPAQQPRPSDPHWTPSFRGGTTQVEKYRFYPLLIVRWSLSNTLARLLMLLTCTICFGRGCAWDIRHTHPYGTKKG
ncbi:hypothetical protein TNIN_121721 [Trichonephila inaurata madagascariensis]|uniref:Uncharacterized protein n=1 Tax=Trichonephila inaurata madagascariensis TaxID=2747483 RepID=A0A8X7BRA8_9ARAC|nr:hypothetical protein TNIN_121721 [Trichonephila inaurata madagascariensis]